MSLTLNDLRVAYTGTDLVGRPFTDHVPVTLADLVDILKNQGAEIKSFDREGIPNHWIPEGTYLVLKVEP